MNSLRDLPAVEHLLQKPLADVLLKEFGRPLSLDALRFTLDDLRAQIKSGRVASPPSEDMILAQAQSILHAWTRARLRLVINATGVILHTNLGRAPLSRAAMHAMESVSQGYSNLEYDLQTGQRGARQAHVEWLLQRLTSAESALVVNNNASAVLLVLAALANRKRVIIARSQLVEIGGGFRIPDVMKVSGAKLVEVGTTNKVRVSDYDEALLEPSALVLRAHRSNFKLIGFTEEPSLRQIAEAAHKAGVPLVDDLGSGAIYDTAKYGLAHEPTVQESLAAGADLVCFSADKLLGGPQAGIILGRRDLISNLAKHPLARALRADKTCLAGLAATLAHFLKDEHEREVPIVRMMSYSVQQLRARAEMWAESLGAGMIITGESTVGGGSLPGESIPTALLALSVPSVEKFHAQLRAANPPIIARTENDRVLLDPRTVLPEQDDLMVDALKKILAAEQA